MTWPFLFLKTGLNLGARDVQTCGEIANKDSVQYIRDQELKNRPKGTIKHFCTDADAVSVLHGYVTASLCQHRP